MSKTKEELIQELIKITGELGWQFLIPKVGDDEDVPGLIIGEPLYVRQAGQRLETDWRTTVLRCHQPTYFDVDDTLVKWNKATDEEKAKAVPFTHPACRGVNADGDIVDYPAWTEYLVPHKKHIEQMKAHKLRGHTVIVWSAGGWQWAETAVRTLGLDKYVDLILEKPLWFYDDLQAHEILGKRIFMKDE
jgi:hypothetical protein